MSGIFVFFTVFGGWERYNRPIIVANIGLIGDC